MIARLLRRAARSKVLRATALAFSLTENLILCHLVVHGQSMAIITRLR